MSSEDIPDDDEYGSFGEPPIGLSSILPPSPTAMAQENDSKESKDTINDTNNNDDENGDNDDGDGDNDSGNGIPPSEDEIGERWIPPSRLHKDTIRAMYRSLVVECSTIALASPVPINLLLWG
jgi:hypothetical protein